MPTARGDRCGYGDDDVLVNWQLCVYAQLSLYHDGPMQCCTLLQMLSQSMCQSPHCASWIRWINQWTHWHPGIDLPLETEEGDPLSWSTPYSPPQHLLQLDGYLNLWLPQSSIGTIIMTGTSHLMNGHGPLGFSVLSLPRNEVKYCWWWDFKILWTEGLCQAFPEHPHHTFMCARLVQHPPQLLSSLQGPEHMTVDQLVT